MAGHTANHRLGVFALKPAPLQISWAGYVGTTGMSAMDFVLADVHQAPAGDEAYYAEGILRMPHCYVPYLPPPNAPGVSPLPARANRVVTFGGFHNPAKINAETLALWGQVLRAVPNARLLLKFRGIDATANRDRILGAMGAAGVESARVTLYGGSAHGELLQAYSQIDIALDPFPYSGGVTTCEALWMGVPVVTMTGASFAGRHATSYLRTVGLDDLVSADEEQYVATAAQLAGDLDSLEALRNTMRTRLSASPLMNYAAYARNFETAMRGAWTTYCAART
jgi:predicted O-linked N-acetylglucosamine transferase (SPINDLY family)